MDSLYIIQASQRPKPIVITPFRVVWMYSLQTYSILFNYGLQIMNRVPFYDVLSLALLTTSLSVTLHDISWIYPILGTNQWLAIVGWCPNMISYYILLSWLIIILCLNVSNNWLNILFFLILFNPTLEASHISFALVTSLFTVSSNRANTAFRTLEL